MNRHSYISDRCVAFRHEAIEAVKIAAIMIFAIAFVAWLVHHVG